MSSSKKKKSFSKGFSKDKKASSEGEKRPWQPLSILNKDDDGPANKKRALRRQRAQTKPYFDAVTASKVLWNELREKKCPEARRSALVAEPQVSQHFASPLRQTRASIALAIVTK